MFPISRHWTGDESHDECKLIWIKTNSFWCGILISAISPLRSEAIMPRVLRQWSVVTLLPMSRSCLDRGCSRCQEPIIQFVSRDSSWHCVTLLRYIMPSFMNNLCRHHGSRLSPSVGFISHSNIFIITQYEGQIMNLFLIIEVHREMCHSTKQNQAKFISALNKRFLFKVTTQIWETLMST